MVRIQIISEYYILGKTKYLKNSKNSKIIAAETFEIKCTEMDGTLLIHQYLQKMNVSVDLW